MKKIVFALVILCAASGLKAQQLPMSPRLPLNKFKLLPDSLNNSLLFKFKDSLRNGLSFRLQDSALNRISNPLARPDMLATNDRMPIVSSHIRSNMPVVQTDKTGYTMPILGQRPHGVYNMKQMGMKNDWQQCKPYNKPTP